MTFDWTEKWVSCLCCMIGLPCIPPLAHEGCGGNCFLSVLIPCWPICCWDPNKDKEQGGIIIQNYAGSPQQGYPQTYQGPPQNYGSPQQGPPQNYQGPPQNYGAPQNL